MESVPGKHSAVEENDEEGQETTIGADTAKESRATPPSIEAMAVNRSTEGKSDASAKPTKEQTPVLGSKYSSLKDDLVESDDEKMEAKDTAAPTSKRTEVAANQSSGGDATKDSIVDGVATSRSPTDLSCAIPRKKRRRLENESLHDDNDSVRSDKGATDSPMDVSLAKLKRQVLGRDLRVDEDENDWEDEDDAEIRQIRALMNAPDAKSDDDNALEIATAKEADKKGDSESKGLALTKKDQSSPSPLAEKLRKDLMCAICHEVVYPPVALPCGHSFCQSCIDWWLGHDKGGRCPTCRRRSYAETSPNLALRACVMAMFGSEIVQRIQNRKKLRPKGENGGAHNAGYQVLSRIEDETWHYVGVAMFSITSPTSEATIGVRRSIVLDAEDQRMHLALAVHGKPIKDVIAPEDLPDDDSCMSDRLDGHGGKFRVDICLLTMEEDEAADSGFPTNVLSPEDELLVCGGSRSRYTHLDVQMKDDYGNISPLARVSADASHGRFKYLLNPSKSAGNARTETIRTLLFEHSETGLKLEIDLSRLQKRAGGSSALNRGRHYRDVDYDMEEDEEMEDQNEFEEDGFLVGDDDSNVEGTFSGDEDASIDDEDRCVICKDGGELMICDGGDKHPGCGKSFHAECVDRSAIPEGDWICQSCAKDAGINTGIVGHEFREPEETSVKSRDGDVSRRDTSGDSDVDGVFSDEEPKDAESQQDNDDASASSEKQDDEDRIPVKASENGNKAGKKRRFVLEDSDSD